jgi:hypothetical protein
VKAAAHSCRQPAPKRVELAKLLSLVLRTLTRLHLLIVRAADARESLGLLVAREPYACEFGFKRSDASLSVLVSLRVAVAHAGDSVVALSLIRKAFRAHA